MEQEISKSLDMWLTGAHSRGGRRVTQEDHCAVHRFETADGMPALLLLVADGVGGQNAGERASSIAEQVVTQRLTENAPITSEIPQALTEAFQEANRRILQESEQMATRSGMATTCTVVVLIGERLYLAHVGDSRAYLVRGKRIHLLSIDHTWAEEALAAGRSIEEIRVHPNRGVIKRYLGITDDADVDTRYRSLAGAGQYIDSATQPLHLEPGDSLFLCSDGVSDTLQSTEIWREVRRQAAPDAAQAIVELAFKEGANDNITAVVADLPGAKKGGLFLPNWAPWVALAAAILIIVGGALAIFGGWWQPSESTRSVTGTVTVVVTPQVTLAVPTAVAGGVEVSQPTGAQPEAEPSDDASDEMATLMPTVTLVPTPVATDTLTPIPTPRTYFDVPSLQSPGKGEWLESDKVTFEWLFPKELRPSEQFLVRISRKGEGEPFEEKFTRLQTLEWQLPGEGEYEWYVVIRRSQSSGAEEWIEVSDHSETRWFGYKKPTPKPVEPTPKPVEPTRTK